MAKLREGREGRVFGELAERYPSAIAVRSLQLAISPIQYRSDEFLGDLSCRRNMPCPDGGWMVPGDADTML